jgi:uncharacterized protein YwgA
MDRLRRDVILIRLIEALRERGSWCGETHIQKAAYLLQEMVGVPMGFDFILYKHGPFSFELRDELSVMRADGFVSLRVQDPAYGPSIVPEPQADVLRKRFPKTLKEHEARIEFIAERLNRKPVVELERLATAFYVLRQSGEKTEANTIAQEVHAMKPHIAADQALPAVRTVLEWTGEADKFRPQSQA